MSNRVNWKEQVRDLGPFVPEILQVEQVLKRRIKLFHEGSFGFTSSQEPQGGANCIFDGSDCLVFRDQKSAQDYRRALLDLDEQKDSWFRRLTKLRIQPIPGLSGHIQAQQTAELFHQKKGGEILRKDRPAGPRDWSLATFTTRLGWKFWSQMPPELLPSAPGLIEALNGLPARELWSFLQSDELWPTTKYGWLVGLDMAGLEEPLLKKIRLLEVFQQELHRLAILGQEPAPGLWAQILDLAVPSKEPRWGPREKLCWLKMGLVRDFLCRHYINLALDWVSQALTEGFLEVHSFSQRKGRSVARVRAKGRDSHWYGGEVNLPTFEAYSPLESPCQDQDLPRLSEAEFFGSMTGEAGSEIDQGPELDGVEESLDLEDHSLEDLQQELSTYEVPHKERSDLFGQSMEFYQKDPEPLKKKALETAFSVHQPLGVDMLGLSLRAFQGDTKAQNILAGELALELEPPDIESFFLTIAQQGKKDSPALLRKKQMFRQLLASLILLSQQRFFRFRWKHDERGRLYSLGTLSFQGWSLHRPFLLPWPRFSLGHHRKALGKFFPTNVLTNYELALEQYIPEAKSFLQSLGSDPLDLDSLAEKLRPRWKKAHTKLFYALALCREYQSILLLGEEAILGNVLIQLDATASAFQQLGSMFYSYLLLLWTGLMGESHDIYIILGQEARKILLDWQKLASPGDVWTSLAEHILALPRPPGALFGMDLGTLKGLAWTQRNKLASLSAEQKTQLDEFQFLLPQKYCKIFTPEFCYALLLALRLQYQRQGPGDALAEKLLERKAIKGVLMILLYGASTLTRLWTLREQGWDTSQALWGDKFLLGALARLVPEKKILDDYAQRLAGLDCPLIWDHPGGYWCFMPQLRSGTKVQRILYRLPRQRGAGRSFTYVTSGGLLDGRAMRRGLPPHLAHLKDAGILVYVLERWLWSNMITIHDGFYVPAPYRDLLVQTVLDGYRDGLSFNVLLDLIRKYLPPSLWHPFFLRIVRIISGGNFVS